MSLVRSAQEDVLSKEADIDFLTGVLTKRKFTERGGRLLASRRHCKLILIDLDEFKQVNDNHGHAAGDAVLRELGRVLGASTSGN
jgi:diguanylate cyclase (GGDEF)-like protein